MKNREMIFTAMPFREECFGQYMTQSYIRLEHHLSVKQAMRRLIDGAGTCDNIDMLFVTDEKGCYLGAMEMKRLITARDGTAIETLLDADYPFVLEDRPIDENIEQLKCFAGGTLPVLDEGHHLLGVISVEDMLDILEEELEEDYARLGGLTEGEELQERLGHSLQKRLPWLAVLLVLGLGVSTLIDAFSPVFERLSAVVCFQSLILGMAGNGGTQSLAVTVRLLSDKNLQRRQRLALLLKEIRVGFVGGLLLGLFSCGIVTLYAVWLQGAPWQFALSLGGCVGLALWCAMTLSAAAGTWIPLLFKGIGVDPAVASGPLITTLNDLSAVMIYYGLTWILLIRLAGFGG